MEGEYNPRIGDLVKAVQYGGQLTNPAVIVDRVFSWVIMGDSYIIQFNDGGRRAHVARDQIKVVSGQSKTSL